jgi:predicted transcriptional regulator of viral defense system
VLSSVKYTAKQVGMQKKHVSIRDLPDALLAEGVHSATTAEIQGWTGLSDHAVHEGMARLRAAGKAFSPTKGLYVLIPPQYRGWGAVPALDFVDPMMRILGRSYYVAMLSAAELHGAAHQRPQAFQVMVDRAVSDRRFGRVRLEFFLNKQVASTPVVMRNSATGTVRVASPAATALDLAARPGDGGGLANVATVVSELADGVGLDPVHIVAAARTYRSAVLRRLGWLLERVEAPVDLLPLEHQLLQEVSGRATALLDPHGPRVGRTDRRWGIVENAEVEPDL